MLRYVHVLYMEFTFGMCGYIQLEGAYVCNDVRRVEVTLED